MKPDAFYPEDSTCDSGRHLVRLAIRIALVVAVIVTLSSASPATAATQQGRAPAATQAGGHFFVRSVSDPGWCLGATWDNVVYSDPCFLIPYAMRVWKIHGDGLIQSWGNGYCLTLLPGWDVNTQPCAPGRRYQQWDAWDGGWTRERFDGVCLVHWSSPPQEVSASTCSPGWTAELWDWEFVF